MTKRCRVLSSNEAVFVFDYDGVKVQMSTTENVGDFVYVDYSDGKYKLAKEVDVKDNESATKQVKKKKTTKEVGKSKSGRSGETSDE